MNVAELKPPPNADLIEALEDLLTQAKTGELQGLIYICSYNDSMVSHGWTLSTVRNHMRLLGAVSFLNNEMLTNEAFRDEDSVIRKNFDRE